MTRTCRSLAFTVLLAACTSSEPGGAPVGKRLAMSESAPMAAAPAHMEPGGGAPLPPPATPDHPGQYVIRNAYLRVRVDDLAGYAAQITTLTRAHGGYVQAQSASKQGAQAEASFTLRVPAAKLDAFLAGLTAPAAQVVDRNVTTDDVTAQYVDTEARIKSRQAVEAQYLALLKQAKSVQDMVAIQEKLGQIREEIESAEAVRQSLAGQVAYATVNLTAFQELDREFFGGGGWSKAVAGAFREGIALLFGFVLFVVRLWPFVAAGLVIVLALRLRRRR